MTFHGFGISKLLVCDGDQLVCYLSIEPAPLARLSVLSFGLELVNGLLLRVGREREREQDEHGKEFGHYLVG